MRAFACVLAICVADAQVVLNEAQVVIASGMPAVDALSSYDSTFDSESKSSIGVWRKSLASSHPLPGGFGIAINFTAVDQNDVAVAIGSIGFARSKTSPTTNFVVADKSGTTRLSVSSVGNVNVPTGSILVPMGDLNVTSGGVLARSINDYRAPPLNAIRVCESDNLIEKAILARMAKPSLLLARQSRVYNLSSYKHGFGTSITFGTISTSADSLSVKDQTTIGSLAMHHLGDGTGAGDFVVKLYNGAAKQEGSNSNMFGHFVNDEIGTFDRLRVHSAGGVDAISSVYPVVNGLRTKESDDDLAKEDVWSTVTKSSLTATRVSTRYGEAKMKKGFGADISFQTKHLQSTRELGTIGFAHTGSGGPEADFIVKTWNGADSLDYPDDSGAINGKYTMFVINSTGDAHLPKGSLFVSSTRYPVVDGLRVKESEERIIEEVWSRVTKSGLTATRVSTKYTLAQMKAGFGADASFETKDKDGKTTEMGTLGFAHTGNGGPEADFIIKAWAGADSKNYPDDNGARDGKYTQMFISSQGDVHFPRGSLTTKGPVTAASLTVSGDILIWGGWSVATVLSGLVAGVVISIVFNFLLLALLFARAAPAAASAASSGSAPNLAVREPAKASSV